MGLIPLVLIPQVILGGMISKFIEMGGFEKFLAAFMTSRWSLEAMMILEYEDTRPEVITNLGFSLNNFATDIFVIIAYSVLFFLLTAYSLKRKDVS